MTAQEEFSGGSSYSCYDAITYLDDAMRESLAPGQRYYVLGGIATGALRDPSSAIDEVTQRVIARPDSDIPTTRDNGTRRDVDILVDDILSPEEAEKIKHNVATVIKDQLVVSVFGFDDQEAVAAKHGTTSALSEWISRRTVDAGGTLRYSLYPLLQHVQPESYNPWRLALPSGRDVAVLHPVGHALAYSMRSISGVRTKDEEKYYAMWRNLVRHQTLVEELHDGVFKEWQRFADNIARLNHGDFVDPESLYPDSTRAARIAFRAKGRLLHWAESRQGLVDFAQGEAIQRVLNTFVRAK